MTPDGHFYKKYWDNEIEDELGYSNHATLDKMNLDCIDAFSYTVLAIRGSRGTIEMVTIVAGGAIAVLCIVTLIRLVAATLHPGENKIDGMALVGGLAGGAIVYMIMEAATR